MHARVTLALGAVGASLAFAGPALAAPTGPLSGLPHPPAASHHTITRTVAAAAATGTDPTLYVNGTTGSDSGGCINQATPCQTIQYAIDQAPTTAKISVAAGSYPEQLTITDKNLAITGAGKTKTTIDPTTLPQTEGSQTPVVYFQGGTDGLSGVTVDGTGVTGAVTCPTGVDMSAAGGKLSSDNVMVSSLVNASFSCGYGVYAGDSSNGDVHSLAVNALSVRDYGDAGVYCYDNESCNVSGTQVVGYGPNGAGAQYGIYVEDAPTARILGDTVTGNAFTSPQFTGSNYDYTNEGIGLAAFNIGTLLVSKNTITGNDMGFFGDDNTGSWTITANTFSHATNDTGSAPGSAPVPDGNFIGDGLDLYQVNGVIVDGNTITSNADRGINLIDTTNSTFSTAANGRGNTVSHNGDDGIALTDYFGDPFYAYAGTSSGNTFSGNVIDANSGDGIYAAGNDPNGNPDQQDNTFTSNTMLGNLRWDALDQSTGTASDGTANTWTSNTCKTSSPAGICTAIAS